MTDANVEPDRAEQLRNQVVDQLVADGTIVSKPVEAAMRTVPRHLFAPEASLEDAYHAYNAVITKKDEYGVAKSSVSAPQIQAMMIEQAGIVPGMRVLEVGSGGYNAALLAELVAKTGEVTSVDIDPEVIERARRLLAQTGYDQVRLVLADAEAGVPEYAPYDRILITVGAWDIPPAWVDQLAEDGRLVVPLRMRGLTRSVAFDRHGDHLSSVSAEICGFVPMQGAGAHETQLLLVRGTNEIGLRFDDEVLGSPSELDNAVLTERAETWTGVTVGRTEPLDGLQMYLATVLDGFCTMAVDKDLDTGVVAPSNPWFSLAAVEGGNFGYVTTRRTADEQSVEFGVHALGPQGSALAEKIAEHVRAWDRERRGGPGPHFAVFPVGTPDDQLPGGRVINKRHCRIVISWPSAVNTAGDQAAPHELTKEGA